MAKQEKFITSHSARVKRANEYCKNSAEKISIIDREAIVEHFLLEDIERLCKARLVRIINSPNETSYGKRSGIAAERLLRATLHIITSAIEVSKNKIILGRYKDVWRAIPEGALMRAAKNMKYLDKMRSMLEELLGELDEEALEAIKEVLIMEEKMDDAAIHEANYCQYHEINVDNFNAVTNPTVSVKANDNKNGKTNNNPNLL